MGKFSKAGGREMPELNTSSLPDLVFAFLFFIMMVTSMREVTLKVEFHAPQATELQKLEKKSLVTFIYVGKPTEEMSKRRIGFYERLGFVLDHHVYFQPPYRKGEAFLEMRLMTHGKLDLEQSFERVKTIIHQNVYGVE